MIRRPKLGRPKLAKKVLFNLRLTETQRDDLRRCAIAHNVTMTDFILRAIKNEKARLSNRGEWPEEVDR
jgi:uncharacterized protein (DUF1778 family)